MKERLKVERGTQGFILKLYLHSRQILILLRLYIIYRWVLMEIMGAFPNQAIFLIIFHNT